MESDWPIDEVAGDEGRAGAVIMPFGKYRGRPLTELPSDYLTWLAGLANLREPLRSAVTAESERRTAHARPARRPAPEVLAMAEEVVTIGYRALTLQLHPDRGGATHRMQILNAAMTWLRGSIRSLAA
jgi:hypothetical protein